MTVSEWKENIARGLAAYAILSTLSSGPKHGYEIARSIRESGFGELKGGKMYPTLTRLHEQRLLDFEWHVNVAGPAKKIYSLTSLGQEELRDARVAWHYLGLAIESLGK